MCKELIGIKTQQWILWLWQYTLEFSSTWMALNCWRTLYLWCTVRYTYLSASSSSREDNTSTHRHCVVSSHFRDQLPAPSIASYECKSHGLLFLCVRKCCILNLEATQHIIQNSRPFTRLLPHSSLRSHISCIGRGREKETEQWRVYYRMYQNGAIENYRTMNLVTSEAFALICHVE